MALTRPLINNLNTNVEVFNESMTVLNAGATSANVDVGFIFNRAHGLLPNTSMYWSESLQSFVYAFTNNAGVTASNITISNYANVQVGNILFVNGAGLYINGNLGAPGSVLGSNGTSLSWVSGGGFNGGVISAPLLINNTTVATSSTSGALQVTGGVGIGGNVYIAGNVSANYFVGNAAYLTGLPSQYSNANVASYLVTNTGNISSLNVFPGNLYVTTTAQRSGKNIVTNFSGNAAPSSPLQGDEWFAGNVGVLYKYLYDNVSNTFNWVNINSALFNANTAAVANTLALRDSGGNLTATNFLGTASSAKYADLAEMYTADDQYGPGTVVVFGGEYEVTVTDQSHDARVAGVISTNPAYLMNSESSGVPVAFTGRVPCQVMGPIVKGQLLVTSQIAGVAEALNNEKFVPGCVIGKSLENINTSTISTIEVVVGRF